MRPILLAIAAGLSIALYRMISRGGKTYTYNSTQIVSLGEDGNEHIVSSARETGPIIIMNKTVLIDGVEYYYKPMDGEPLQALLEYENGNLSSVNVLLPEGEKRFIIEKGRHAGATPKTA